MLTFLAGIAEFERENLFERQREGIAIAKRNGVYKGRKPFMSEQFDELYNDYLCRKISKTEFAKLLGVSRPTLYRLIRENTE